MTENEYLILDALQFSSPMHGYQIMKAVDLMTNGKKRLATGHLYPALHELIEAGLVRVTERVDADAPARRYYEPSEEGRRAGIEVAKDVVRRVMLAPVFS